MSQFPMGKGLYSKRPANSDTELGLSSSGDTARYRKQGQKCFISSVTPSCLVSSSYAGCVRSRSTWSTSTDRACSPRLHGLRAEAHCRFYFIAIAGCISAAPFGLPHVHYAFLAHRWSPAAATPRNRYSPLSKLT